MGCEKQILKKAIFIQFQKINSKYEIQLFSYLWRLIQPEIGSGLFNKSDT